MVPCSRTSWFTVTIPEEINRPVAPVPTDDTLNLLKKEMLGLTQTVKSLSSQFSGNNLSKMASSPNIKTRVVPNTSEVTAAPSTGVHGKRASNSSKADSNSSAGNTNQPKKKKASVPIV